MPRRVSELERGSMVATVMWAAKVGEVFINQTSTGMLCRKQNQVRSWGESGDQCHSWGGDWSGCQGGDGGQRPTRWRSGWSKLWSTTGSLPEQLESLGVSALPEASSAALLPLGKHQPVEQPGSVSS